MNLPFDPRRLDDMLARGETIPVNNEPLEEWMAPGHEYVTRRAYEVDEFTKKDYEGPDKEARLKHLEQYARDWEKEHDS